MQKREENIIYQKAFAFAIKIVEIYRYLNQEENERVLSKQMLRSGTSIGANIREGLEAQSKKDFISKLSISLKEASETEYWLELLRETGYIDKRESELLLNDVKEIIKILNAIIKTSKST